MNNDQPRALLHKYSVYTKHMEQIQCIGMVFYTAAVYDPLQHNNALLLFRMTFA